MGFYLHRVEEYFQKMELEGFNTKSPLKWSFYFVHTNSGELQDVYAELKDHSYHLDYLNETEDGLWQLKVSKIEVLTPDKLHRRNLAFNELANYCSVDTYDGWEVDKQDALN
ncbi:hypothetical protein GCM10028803_05140 [Larkinella knui]|uniref:Regulator of ribonuclease activity B domain-containing protein n=1 Tax=Larkinella knui TaxID=2025310 RepID=A0A3P1CKR8_9BACT|nr:ribonuclease E inhibitor RraB [Larkinella knui]RRB13808.1 hypothetical protein EHT87_16245 [Larkinella knui]